MTAGDGAPAGGGDWPAVATAVRGRLRELRRPVAWLARETGLSETTIRYIGQPGNGHNKVTLVVMSAVLGWHHHHLVAVLHGEADGHDGPPPCPPDALEDMARQVRDIDEKLSRLLADRERQARTCCYVPPSARHP